MVTSQYIPYRPVQPYWQMDDPDKKAFVLKITELAEAYRPGAAEQLLQGGVQPDGGAQSESGLVLMSASYSYFSPFGVIDFGRALRHPAMQIEKPYTLVEIPGYGKKFISGLHWFVFGARRVMLPGPAILPHEQWRERAECIDEWQRVIGLLGPSG